jgi:hypothetical protein
VRWKIVPAVTDGLVATAPTLLEPPRPDEIALSLAAPRALEPVGPANLSQVSPAALLVRKAFLELDQIARKAHPGSSLQEPGSPPPTVSTTVTG